MTFPSFSGTFGIPATQYTNQKCQKSLQTLPAPTHDNSQPEQKFRSPWIDNRLIMNNAQPITHGIVHAGFSGMRAFVARKKGRCKLIGNRLVIPHDTIP